MKKAFLYAAMATAVLSGTLATSCTQKKFHVEGQLTEAKDSLLYFEHVSLNGPVALDSVRLDEDGRFAFAQDAPSAPEFYRLRIAGQIINLSVDSTETITVKAQYPTMSTAYEVSGSAESLTIKELALKQMMLQQDIDAVAATPRLDVREALDSINTLVERYKEQVKRQYIFPQPMKAHAYFALFQAVALGGQSVLLFNPRNSEEDVKVYGAVATSWDNFYPGAERGENLHNIAIEGMKDARVLRARRTQEVDASKVDLSGVIDIALKNNHGSVSRLSDLKGKVVLLDFHLFADKESPKRIMQLREVYNKYHAQGLEIYQVALDKDEHFWKTQTAALPWISVRLTDSDANVLSRYNVRDVPTYFLLDRSVNVRLRDVQIRDFDAEVKALF